MTENNEVEAVDLDLAELDAQLRESIGKPTVVRIGDVAVHINNAADWTGMAMQASEHADWDKWASEVIEDEDELEAFLDAGLKNYQLNAIFEKCGELSNLSSGKSRRSGNSSRRTPRK